MDAGPHRSSRRRHRGVRERAVALRGARPRPGERRPPVLLGRSRIGARQLSRLHHHRPARRGPGVRRLHRGVRRRRRGAPRRRARRRHPHRHRPRRRDPRPRTRRPTAGACDRARRPDAPRAARAPSPAPAAATRAATPTSGCGCAPTSSGVGSAHALTIDAAARAAARGGRPAGHPARAAQPARRQLRHRGHPRRGRGVPGPLRPAGQGAGRMAAQPTRRHPGGVA